MSIAAADTVRDHLDFLVMQPDHERAVVRDLVFAVLAFNKHSRGEPLQISFPLYTDPKVSARDMLGPCIRVTGPGEKLYVLALRYEVAAHLRAGRAMTFVRDRAVVAAGRNERFRLVSSARTTSAAERARGRPLVLAGQSQLLEAADRLGAAVRDEAALVARDESPVATEGDVDLLGFSARKTLPVLR